MEILMNLSIFTTRDALGLACVAEKRNIKFFNRTSDKDYDSELS
jgi:hypothetical protein